MKKSEIRIVIVDDEPDYQNGLKRNSGIRGAIRSFGEAADGFDAVELAERMYQIWSLLDIKMPLMDGLSAAQIIHEQGLAGSIVFLTAYSDVPVLKG